MNLDEVDRIKIVAWAKSHSEIKQVFLYGSRARGNNKKDDADIDLGIVMNTENGADEAYSMWSSWRRKFEECPDLILSLDVHLEWYEKDAGLDYVGPGVERDGILLYNSDGQ